MLVRNHHLVPALVVGLGLTDAEGDAVGFRVRVDLVAAALVDLGEALEELDRGWWVAFHNEVDVTVLVCKDLNVAGVTSLPDWWIPNRLPITQ